jgi:hypothetical protein
MWKTRFQIIPIKFQNIIEGLKLYEYYNTIRID